AVRDGLRAGVDGGGRRAAGGGLHVDRFAVGGAAPLLMRNAEARTGRILAGALGVRRTRAAGVQRQVADRPRRRLAVSVGDALDADAGVHLADRWRAVGAAVGALAGHRAPEAGVARVAGVLRVRAGVSGIDAAVARRARVGHRVTGYAVRAVDVVVAVFRILLRAR